MIAPSFCKESVFMVQFKTKICLHRDDHFQVQLVNSMKLVVQTGVQYSTLVADLFHKTKGN